MVQGHVYRSITAQGHSSQHVGDVNGNVHHHYDSELTPIYKNYTLQQRQTKLVEFLATGNAKHLKLLLLSEVYLEYKDQAGNTPLLVAFKKGHAKCVRLLLEAYANPNVTDRNDESALTIAARHNYQGMTELLIRHGAIVDPAGNRVKNPLRTAALYGSVRVAETLLQHKPDIVNSCNFNGITALHNAASCGHIQMVAYLLDHGADFQARSRQGYTAMVYASKNGHQHVANYIRQRAARTRCLQL